MKAAMQNAKTAKDTAIPRNNPDLIVLIAAFTTPPVSFREFHNLSTWSRNSSGSFDFIAAACHSTALSL
jgi:hypothetical protein